MKDNNSDLVLYVLKDKTIYEALEYLYVNEKVYSADAKSFCSVHKLDTLKTKKLVDRVFWKRGTYVGSLYTINKKGRYIFELVSLFRASKKADF
jgi:hypothetical protein